MDVLILQYSDHSGILSSQEKKKEKKNSAKKERDSMKCK